MHEFKKGTLVIIIKANNPRAKKYIGTIHELLEKSTQYQDSWRTNPLIHLENGNILVLEEPHIIPIRDQGGEDETLTWAPVPKEIQHA